RRARPHRGRAPFRAALGSRRGRGRTHWRRSPAPRRGGRQPLPPHDRARHPVLPRCGLPALPGRRRHCERGGVRVGPGCGPRRLIYLAVLSRRASFRLLTLALALSACTSCKLLKRNKGGPDAGAGPAVSGVATASSAAIPPTPPPPVVTAPP